MQKKEQKMSKEYEINKNTGATHKYKNWWHKTPSPRWKYILYFNVFLSKITKHSTIDLLYFLLILLLYVTVSHVIMTHFLFSFSWTFRLEKFEIHNKVKTIQAVFPCCGFFNSAIMFVFLLFSVRSHVSIVGQHWQYSTKHNRWLQIRMQTVAINHWANPVYVWLQAKTVKAWFSCLKMERYSMV